MLHFTEHCFNELHTDVLWLTSFSGEMVIYAFLLGFSSPSCQKEWFKIWKIRDQPNQPNHIKDPQSSHYIVVHENVHLSYKRYKVWKICFKGHPRYICTNIHKHTLFLYFFFLLKKLKTKQKQTNKQPKHQTRFICMKKRREKERSVNGYNTNILVQEFKASTI